LKFYQNQIWPVFVSCYQDQTKRLYYFFSTNFVDLIFLPQNHIQHVQFWHPRQKLWQFELLPKPYLAGFCIVQPGPNKRLCYFFSTNFVHLIFLPQNHIQYVQFWQQGQKLCQFEVLLKPDLASFCIMQPGPNQETLLFF